jgi:hypothetical protein
MKKILQFAAALALCTGLTACSPDAARATAATAAAPVVATKEMEAVSGHYYLQGVTEVGSELLLRKDGQFRWMLAYGAVDQQAEGTWQMTGQKLELTATGSSTGFKKLILTLDQGKLAMDDPDTGMKGSYVKQP